MPKNVKIELVDTSRLNFDGLACVYDNKILINSRIKNKTWLRSIFGHEYEHFWYWAKRNQAVKEKNGATLILFILREILWEFLEYHVLVFVSIIPMEIFLFLATNAKVALLYFVITFFLACACVACMYWDDFVIFYYFCRNWLYCGIDAALDAYVKQALAVHRWMPESTGE